MPVNQAADLSGKVIACAIEVHTILGPGLLESAYEVCLVHEIRRRSIPVQRQVSIPVRYKGLSLSCAYRADMIVDNSMIVEVKAVSELLPVHLAQTLTYLRLTGLTLGLIINFNASTLVKGIKRVVNNHS